MRAQRGNGDYQHAKPQQQPVLQALRVVPVRWIERDLVFQKKVIPTFVGTIPYRFYPIFALVMVFTFAWTRRHFGPMRSAQRLSRDDAKVRSIAIQLSVQFGDPAAIKGLRARLADRKAPLETRVMLCLAFRVY